MDSDVWYKVSPKIVATWRAREFGNHTGDEHVVQSRLRSTMQETAVDGARTTASRRCDNLSYPCNHEVGSEVSQNNSETGTENDNMAAIFELQIDKSDDIVRVDKKSTYLDEPVDTHNYTYRHNPWRTCLKEDGKKLNVLVVFLALTAPGNFLRRQVIRSTYGDSRSWNLNDDMTVRTVFLLGAIENTTLQKEIDVEFQRHSDIVQEDFVDNYMNLSRKTIMGLKWVTKHCRHAHFAMKIDDDTMMNQKRLIKILTTAPTSNFVGGKVWPAQSVVRNKKRRFYLSEEFYPHPTYPPYMDGPAYIMSTDVVEKVYREAIRTPLFPWEDAFIGICLKKAGIQDMKDVKNFSRFRLSKDLISSNKTQLFTVITNMSPDTMTWLWKIGKVS
ncbi:beta-1,3-galactosyltransferase 1-like [Diadema antillarum]|uniref:beta-1,3-galactosyltransferase 1-like n=1 Tax=Diadema antillarum TaxID=105358 RepID=UPI003A8A2B6C